jgi:hypothetical protein
LPAVNELKLCYNSLPIVNEIFDVINGFQASGYWSSTESEWSSSSRVWGQDFDDGHPFSGYYKYYYNGVAVRAVRRF